VAAVRWEREADENPDVKKKLERLKRWLSITRDKVCG